MSDLVTVSLITAVSVAAPSIFGAYMSYLTNKISRRSLQVAKRLEENTNGMKTELLKITAEASHAKGVLEEKGRHDS